MNIEFFAVNETLAQLEADLISAKEDARMSLLLTLSWQLRQRNTKQALALADEVENWLANKQATLPEHTQRSTLGRLLLIRGEAHYLMGNFPASKHMAHQALQEFSAIKDAPGCCDAHFLLTWIEFELGEMTQVQAGLEAMITIIAGTDMVRLAAAQTALARILAFKDGRAAKQRWGHHFATDSTTCHPAVGCWIEDFWASVATQSGDYVQAIRHRSHTYALALESGQHRRAILAAISIGDAFSSLNEYHTALEWVQRGLDLARSREWPGMIGFALMQTAEILRRLQRFDNAYDMLRDALTMTSPMSSSRYYASALLFMGEVELDRMEYASAMSTFKLLEQRAIELKQSQHLFSALRGQAQALFLLGQAPAALRAAKAALISAESNPDHQIKVLRVMAEIHSRYPALRSELPPDRNAPKTPLYYLQQALDLAATIQGYNIPGELLDAIAEEHASLGDWQKAYQFAKQASIAREKTHNTEATNRAHAIQLSHQTERAQAHDAHLRELASEAKRAEILQQTSKTLEHLGVIGQEITAHLETDRVFEILNRHVHGLLNTDVFAIALTDRGGLGLSTVFGVDDGQPIPLLQFSMGDADFIRDTLERREVLIERDPNSPDPNWHLPSMATCSRLYAPLRLADTVLGVMTIQSRKCHAYGAREQLIFRSLCAYTAIAISNAGAHGELNTAHRQLKETQQQLVLQGKMAGLGTLTAGIAHEINNPTNFVHVAAQNQRIDITEFEQFVARLIEEDTEPAIMQAFANRFAKLAGNVTTMLNGTERIKGIVKDLRAFTRLDESEKKSVRLSECLTSTLNLVRTSWAESVEFITEFADDPAIECWPALLNQVFMNLLVNGCQAIDEKQRQEQDQEQERGQDRKQGKLPEKGKLWLRLNVHGDTVIIAFQDTGTGIDSAKQARIMEPFYTTKAVGVGTGLGLSIAFGIIQKHGGDLNFTSTPGIGSCFTIRLPSHPSQNSSDSIDHQRGSKQ